MGVFGFGEGFGELADRCVHRWWLGRGAGVADQLPANVVEGADVAGVSSLLQGRDVSANRVRVGLLAVGVVGEEEGRGGGEEGAGAVGGVVVCLPEAFAVGRVHGH